MRTVFHYIFILNVAATLLLSGSSEAAASPLTTVWMVLLFVVAAIGLGPAQRGQLIFWLAICMTFGLVLWAWVQHMNWGGAAFQFRLPGSGDEGGAFLLDRESISIVPADTLAAIPNVIKPFLAFLTAMMIATNDKESIGLLRSLGALGGVIAIFSTLEFLFPRHFEMIAIGPPSGSLASVFINHNTAATFLGMVVLVLAAICLGDLYLDDRDGKGRVHRGMGVTFNCTALGFASCALLLTRSRAGIASTLIGLCILAVVLSYRNRHSKNYRARSLLQSLDWRVLGLFFLCILGFIVMSGRVARAIFEKGYDDPRFCVWPQMLDLLADNALWGTGLGTFEAAFPSYRDPSCGIVGAWDKAHNFYIEAFITVGALFPVALLIFFAMFFFAMIHGLRYRRRLRRYVGLGLAIVALCGLHSILDFSLQVSGVSVYFAVLLGATVSIAFGRHQPSRASRNGAVA